MHAENVNFCTPKQTKRLGLRRNSSIIKNSSAIDAAVCSGKSKSTIENPASTPKRRLPQSDAKINYKDLEKNSIDRSNLFSEINPDTPSKASEAYLQRLTVSTNCRPYRLALSKRVREKMTKKRLEFYLANEMEKDQQIVNEETLDDDATEKKFNTKEELLKQIEIAKKELNARQEHLKKVNELQQVIAIWKTGFSSALYDLQEKLEPRLETADLLQKLHIPHEMIKYIND